MLATFSHLLTHGFLIMVHLVILLVIRLFFPLSPYMATYLVSSQPMVLKYSLKELAFGTVQLSKFSLLYQLHFSFTWLDVHLISTSRSTRSHDCVVTFTNGNVTLQDQISKRQLGVGCESNGLYYLKPINSVPFHRFPSYYTWSVRSSKSPQTSKVGPQIIRFALWVVSVRKTHS